MPIAYYPSFLRYHLPGTTDFNFLHFWWRTITVGPWPSGPVVVSVGAARARCHRRRGLVGWRPRDPAGVRPADLCLARSADDGLRCVLDRLGRDPICRCIWRYRRCKPGSSRAHYPLPIQTSRILLYSGLLLYRRRLSAWSSLQRRHPRGERRDREDAGRSGLALARAVLWRDPAARSMPTITGWRISRRRRCRGETALRPGVSQCSAPRWRLRCRRLSLRLCTIQAGVCSTRCSRRPTASISCTTSSSSGCNTSSTIHAFPAGVKVAIVFAGTLAMSWALTVLLRKIPFVARMI